jgi:ribonuclease P/MRP protein subunit RPP40
VPQGSVLGPILFIYYINDMPNVVDCNIKIFADDTKLYKHIANISDSDDLQKNILNLNTWSDNWLLQFNSQKCKIMHIGKDNPNYKYQIKDGTILCDLSSTTCEKDLGVHIDPELKFQEHIDIQSKKAKALCGMLMRTLTNKTKDIMVPLFKALVRPILEYSNVVWCPYLRHQIDQIETIQRHFTKKIVGMRNLDYSQRLKELNLPSLEYRRFRGDLIEMFKICHKLYDPLTTKLLFEFVPYNNSTRGHNYKVNKIRTNSKKFSMFFTHRIVNDWNNLPYNTVNSKTMNAFKNSIDNIYKDIIYSTHIKE